MARNDTDPVMQALIYPLDRDLVSRPDGPCLIYNAVMMPKLADYIPPSDGVAWQWWRGPHDSLQAAGYKAVTQTPEGKDFSAVFVRVPHQRDDGFYGLSACWDRLRAGGVMIAAAANDAGGRRLVDDLTPHLPDLQSASKHKCRIVWAVKHGGLSLPAEWRQGGDFRKHAGTGLWTRPGLFNWDRIDLATAMLLQHIPPTLSGSVADLGCGLGVIADHILSTAPNVTRMVCIDADARAVEATKLNLNDRHASWVIDYQWADLSQPFAHDAVNHIVMNPPFHAEKTTAIDLGRAFIDNAARMLKPGGTLWMVANSHLPYEGALAEKFVSITRLHQASGFKIISARR